MAFAFVQAAGGNTTPSPSCTATFTAPPTQGNALAAWIRWVNYGQTITESTGTWIPVGQVTFATSATYALFYKQAGTSEPQTVTFTSGVAAGWQVVLAEYAPGGGTLNLDASSGVQAQGNSTVMTTPTATPLTGRNAAVICFAQSTVNTGTWSNEQINGSGTGVTTEFTFNQGSGNIVLFDQMVASTAGSYSGTATYSITARGAGGLLIFTASSGADVNISLNVGTFGGPT